MNIFEQATRSSLRFESSAGELTVEQLWELPLSGSKEPNLDGIARAVNRELISLEEESFVDQFPNPRRSKLELSLDILKHIIKARQDEKAESVRIAQVIERRRKLKNAIASKENEELTNMSRDELERELQELGEVNA